MLDHLIHAALHKAVEVFEESEIGQKIEDSINEALNNRIESVQKSMKIVCKTLNKEAKAANLGVKAAIKTYKNTQ